MFAREDGNGRFVYSYFVLKNISTEYFLNEFTDNYGKQDCRDIKNWWAGCDYAITGQLSNSVQSSKETKNDPSRNGEKWAMVIDMISLIDMIPLIEIRLQSTRIGEFINFLGFSLSPYVLTTVWSCWVKWRLVISRQSMLEHDCATSIEKRHVRLFHSPWLASPGALMLLPL